MAELSYLCVTYVFDPPMVDIFYIRFVLMELRFLEVSALFVSARHRLLHI